MEHTLAREEGYVQELTEKQSWKLFDRPVHYYLGVSGEEFVVRWESGQYKGPDAEPSRMRWSCSCRSPVPGRLVAESWRLGPNTRPSGRPGNPHAPDALLPRKRHLRGVKGRYYTSATPHPLTLMDGLPVELGGDTGLTVQVSQRYG
jgi:hypothetical protein